MRRSFRPLLLLQRRLFAGGHVDQENAGAIESDLPCELPQPSSAKRRIQDRGWSARLAGLDQNQPDLVKNIRQAVLNAAGPIAETSKPFIGSLKESRSRYQGCTERPTCDVASSASRRADVVWCRQEQPYRSNVPCSSRQRRGIHQPSRTRSGRHSSPIAKVNSISLERRRIQKITCPPRNLRSRPQT